MTYNKSRRHRLGPKSVCGTLVGVIFGFFIATWSRHFCDIHAEWCCLGHAKPRSDHHKLINSNTNTLNNAQSKHKPSFQKNLIFIGVMTAQKYVDSRALASYRTWSKTIPGKVMFFSRAGSKSKTGVPVIGLPGVDDSYPPQKKSFMMLKYIHDNFIDKYEWFMRADDDVYIKGKRLANFLHSVNSSRPQFIGQAGLGNKEEFGQLSLDQNENFCMGGPGMVFSRETLRRVVPHITYCLKNLYTTHEDVEIGRCVRKFAQISCTWAFEMQRLFYQNYREENHSFTGKLKTKDVHRAITLHAIKQPPYVYRLHNYLQTQKTFDLRHKLLLLRREIQFMNALVEPHGPSGDRYGVPPSLHRYLPKQREEVLSWEFISRSLFSHNSFNPRKGLDSSLKEGLEDILMQIMQMINKNARQRGRTIDFKEILYGYRRVNPLHSADYILDLLLVYRKHKGRKMTVPVRRHAYLQQTFTDTEFIEENELASISSQVPVEQPKPTEPPKKPSNIIDFFKEKLGLGLFQVTGQKEWKTKVEKQISKMIHIILPLAGRFATFQRFMTNFEKVCLEAHETVSLAIILFKTETGDTSVQTETMLRRLRLKYPHHELQLVNAKGTFSRAVALDIGAALYLPNSLLFFIDVDIVFNRDVLYRIRLNTDQHKKVYYPIVYSQYDPSVVCSNVTCPSSPYAITNNRGYWRQFGYGIVSVYNSDLKQVGGLDTSILGWGKEDIDLHNKFVQSNLTIFRAVDPGLVHVFHSILCDPQLESSQYQMCLGSKASSYAPVDILADIVHSNKNILNRNDKDNNRTKAKQTNNDNDININNVKRKKR